MVTCDLCGVEGERGDQPGEGKIVPSGGETFGGRIPANGQVCDDCADKAKADSAADASLMAEPVCFAHERVACVECIQSVPCDHPRCGAVKGRPCVQRIGKGRRAKLMPFPHPSRKRAAAQAGLL